MDLSREDFDAVFDSALNIQNIRERTVVKGVVLDIDDERVLVDVGYKAEGAISINEFKDDNGQLHVEIGQNVEVYLDSMNEQELVLSKIKADQMKAWERIITAFKDNEVVSGTITHRVKGGLSVDIGVKAFLPGSQVDLRPVKNLEKLLDQEFEFRIIKLNRHRGNIVLSRRVLLEEERKIKRSETLKKLKVGAIMQGIVKNITEYGAFIDLGGIDGLLHVTDMTYGRPSDPSKMVTVGEKMEVMILRFDEESKRVSLGFKQIHPDPWEEVEVKYPLGAIVRGEVVSVTEYGAFISLEEGIEGLIHSSEISWNPRVKNPNKIFDVGDIVEAKVQEINTEERRISLSMRQLENDPWDNIRDRYPLNAIVRGVIRNITDFGIFVGIEDAIDGLIHVTDLSWSQRNRKPVESYKKGDEIEARVINVDADKRRLSLSIKEMTDDPWLSVQGRYFLGQIIKGRVVSHTDFGIFVEIEDGVEGLVHSTELKNEGDWKELYPIESEVLIEIRRIDSHERKISLSEKGATDNESQGRKVDDFIASQGDTSASLGDVFGELSSKITNKPTE
jgi:small subunit ribosomal protein S1